LQLGYGPIGSKQTGAALLGDRKAQCYQMIGRGGS
jgi:hypothetical protein